MPTTIPTTTSSTRPGSPSAGDAYFETDTKNYIIYDGANWRGYVSDGIPFGKGSTSADFDGVDDYISVADSDSLSFGDGSSDSAFSLAAWVKLDSLSNIRIVTKATGSNQEYSFTANSAGNFGCALYDAIYDNRLSFISSGSSVSTGVWTHVTFTYDGSANTSGGAVYINGNLVTTSGSVTGSYTAMHNTSASFNIGYWNGSTWDQYLNGHLDDVAVIAKELTADEVTAIYNSNSYPLELVSLWRFEGNANDSKGSNNGTGNGGVVLNSTDIR